VGTGKTYIALAVAGTLNRGPTTCLVPATLRAQWHDTAAALGVPVTIHSHEQASRGNLPPTRGLVLIDESHHFRNPLTRRYGHVALWLVGYPALLLTATPVVNHLRDLAHQLLLSIRDDALLLDGIVSLKTLLSSGHASPPLGQLVIEADHPRELRPARVHQISIPTKPEDDSARCIMQSLAQLRLSQTRPIAALLNGVLLRAAASSPAALEGSLRRYRRLLLHARDALAAGRSIDRAELRHFTGDSGDQLIWWELMPDRCSELDLELADITVLEPIIHQVTSRRDNADGKLRRLRDILSDNLPTLIFTTSKDTVRYLRDRLVDLRPAWCTGQRAGIGRTSMRRSAVLSWFRADSSSSGAPRHLIVTDVAAEGLDLQRAARVVHYDLPWTSMRLEQREGRSVRYGSPHAQVTIVRFAVPNTMERSLGLEHAIRRKQGLPARAGLGPDGRELWRWRSQLATQYSELPGTAGTARVAGQRAGLLAGFTLHHPDNGTQLSASVIWVEPDGSWSDSSEVVAMRLAEAVEAKELPPIGREALRDWLTHLTIPVKQRLDSRQGRRWMESNPQASARLLSARLQSLIQQAARLRQPIKLMQLEQAITLVARGHTAGEESLLQYLVNLSDEALLQTLARLPGRAHPPDLLAVRLTGLIVFERGQS
jgi:superfamily II DNA or RNA helicase